MPDTGNAPGAGKPEDDQLAEFKALFAEQRERQSRLRHVQQFLKSPMFLDLREAPVEVSDPPEAIEERKRELDYRIKVLQSLVTLMSEEREALDRAVSAQATQEAKGPPESGEAESGEAGSDGSGAASAPAPEKKAPEKKAPGKKTPERKAPAKKTSAGKASSRKTPATSGAKSSAPKGSAAAKGTSSKPKAAGGAKPGAKTGTRAGSRSRGGSKSGAKGRGTTGESD